MVTTVTASLVSAAALGRPNQTTTGWSPEPAHYGIALTRDVPITTSDGIVLRADIRSPADPKTGRPVDGSFPVLVAETPYGKTPSAIAGSPESAGFAGFAGVNSYLIERGYISVIVDTPGTGGSQGASQLFGPAEARASADVINWAAKLPHSNGKVGMIGGSYLAIDQMFAAAAVGRNSPLKAIFPMAVASDPYRDLFVSGGLVNMESSLGLIAGYAGTRTFTPYIERYNDPVDALNLSLEHAGQTLAFEGQTLRDVLTDGPRRYDGPYWSSRAPQNMLNQIVANGVAVYAVGGLYDVFQRGEPVLYSGLQNAAVGRDVYAPMRPGQPVSGRYQMLFGPWYHGDIGAGTDLNAIELRWFDQWLKGEHTGIADTSNALHVIEPNGSHYDAGDYPLIGTHVRRLNFNLGGALTSATPTTGAGSDAVLFTGLSNLCSRSTDQFAAGILNSFFAGIGVPNPCSDKRSEPIIRPAETAYTTRPLPVPMRLAGPVGVTVQATSTRPETMWVVRLEDVWPDGEVTELSGGAQLGSLRALDPAKSWAAPDGGWFLPYHTLTQASQRPVTPGKLTRYDIQVRPVFATVPAGHRLRVVLGTGDLPHLVPTPSAIGPLLGGMYTVEHNAAAQSWVDLPVVN